MYFADKKKVGRSTGEGTASEAIFHDNPLAGSQNAMVDTFVKF
jgi:hypothetical protein